MNSTDRYEITDSTEPYPDTKEYDIDKKVQEMLESNFTYHSPKDDQPERYVILRKEAKKLAMMIVGLTPKSREPSLALTNLEQAVFWANAAIARNE